MKEKFHSMRMDAPTIILHWTLVISLILSLITGFRIASDNPESHWMLVFDAILLQGQVTFLHIVSATVLSIVAVAYVIYLLKTGLSSRVTLDIFRVKGLWSKESQAKLTAINVLMFWFVYILLIAAGFTGILLYLDSSIAPMAVRLIHEYLAWSVLIYVVVHSLVQFTMGGLPQLLKIINPRAAYGISFVVALTIGSATAGTIFILDKWSVNELHVSKLNSAAPAIDGNVNDPIWKQAKSVTIQTSRGVNESGQNAQVQVKAAHDGEYFYALFEWPDSSRSQKHLPLVKTALGWTVLHTEYDIQDEDSYYEDKFGVMLSHTASIAGAGTAHMGSKPLANKPAPSGGRGLHFTADDSIVDVWHWKSVRSGSTTMNQIDDNYFGPPMTPKTGKSRYTGGYNKDPKTSGGFTMNWEKFSTGIITPKRLPKNPSILKPFQEMDLTPSKGDNVALYMSLSDTVAYREGLDTYPIGTIMPSVLVDAPFAGDRGDVTAVSRWENNKWYLEVKRKLDTGSKFDIAISKYKPVYMWVAVFDHAQTRHSQHIQPIEIIME